MKIENQVVSLEIAIILNELDIPQESHYYYHWYKKNRDYEYIDCVLSTEKADEFDDGKWRLKLYSAFTASELLEMLPNFEEPYRLNFGIEIPCCREDAGGKFFCVSDRFAYPEDYYTHDNNFADCLAKMIVHLTEENIIKDKK